MPQMFHNYLLSQFSAMWLSN